jgi:hypothetical protein
MLWELYTLRFSPGHGIRLMKYPARYCSHKLKMAEAVGLHQWFSFACEKDVFLFVGIIYQSHTCILGYSRKITFRDEIFHPSGYSFFSNTPRSRYKLIIILLRGCNSEVQLLIGHKWWLWIPVFNKYIDILKLYRIVDLIV